MIFQKVWKLLAVLELPIPQVRLAEQAQLVQQKQQVLPEPPEFQELQRRRVKREPLVLRERQEPVGQKERSRPRAEVSYQHHPSAEPPPQVKKQPSLEVV